MIDKIKNEKDAYVNRYKELSDLRNQKITELTNLNEIVKSIDIEMLKLEGCVFCCEELLKKLEVVWFKK